MNWKPHTDHPCTRVPVLLAAADEVCGGYLIDWIFTWDGANFRHEDTAGLPPHDEFWWVPEIEVLEGLPK